MGFGFDDIGNMVGKAAPLVGTLLGGPAGGAVGGMVAKALGTENDPEKIQEAINNNPEALNKIREMETRNQVELEKLATKTEIARIEQQAETHRKAIESNDPYVRRVRPTFGYVVAASILAESAALTYAVLWDPSAMELAVTYVEAIAMPQSLAIAAFGVYVKKRSDDKEVERTGLPKQGLLSKIM